MIYEVSGVPEALNSAISLSGFDSRVVIGSWYGNKAAVIALGGDAHRNRLKISTSRSVVWRQISARAGTNPPIWGCLANDPTTLPSAVDYTPLSLK